MPFKEPSLVLPEKGQQLRTRQAVKGIPRTSWGSRWRSVKEEVEGKHAPPTQRPLGGVPAPRNMRKRATLTGRAILAWALNYMKYLLTSKVGPKPYANPTDGCFRLPGKCMVALAADWGTGTASALNVATCIRKREPDVTIHLGDVYYSGDADEYKDYFLDPQWWPKGRLEARHGDGNWARPTYALNANHEMYSGGSGYFDTALPALQQHTSYFSLATAHWQIVALDTGYRCTRGLSKIWRSIGSVFGARNDDTKLDDGNLNWVRWCLGSDADKQNVILLSHHQWFSAFHKECYPKVGKQLARILPRVHLWFWGHEHKLAGYKRWSPDPHLPPVRARCIGHGGMPIEVDWVNKERPGEAPLVFCDEREMSTAEGTFGYCGFVLLEFDGPTLRVKYVDERDEVLLEETWRQDQGRLTGTITREKDAVLTLYRSLNELTL